MKCKSCNSVTINGAFCHETGCPDSWFGVAIECKWCGTKFVPESKERAFSECCSHGCYVSYSGVDCQCDECAPDEDYSEGHHDVDDSTIVHNPTLEDVRGIVTGFSYKQFVWESDEVGWKPLMVDVQTANVLCTCYDAMKQDKSREKFAEWISKGRPTFVKTVDFCWSCVR